MPTGPMPATQTGASDPVEDTYSKPPTSKLPMVIAGVLGLVILAGGGYVLFKPGPEPVTPVVVDPPPEPKIEKVVVRRRGDVRRAKLYYLRQRSGKAARIREKSTR